MADPKSGVALTFYTQLVDRTTGQFKAAPTIAAGDWKISNDASPALANLASLPSVDPVGSTWVLISLSATENTGPNVRVQGIDAAGAEWNDVGFCVRPTVVTIDQSLPELAQALPSVTPTFAEAMMLLYMALRNKVDVDKVALTKEIHDDAGTVIAKKTLSDDGTTYSEAEMVSGP